MRSPAVADEIVEWAVNLLPELEGDYAYPTGERIEGLPDVAVEIIGWIYTDFPGVDGSLNKLQQIQQLRFKRWEVQVLLVVAPNPEEEADKLVKDMADRLGESIILDKTLGGRFSWVGDSPRATFDPPYVEFEDGTQGRLATVHMNVGQIVEE